MVLQSTKWLLWFYNQQNDYYGFIISKMIIMVL